MKDPQWSTGGKSMSLVTTVYPSKYTVDYFGAKVDSEWSTAENWTSLETTVESRSIAVVNCMLMVTTGTLIKIQCWLLYAKGGISVVHCRECNLIGDYCGDKKGSQWSTTVNGKPLDTTETSIWIYCMVDYWRPMKDPQWSTGKNWMSLGVPVTSIKWHSGQLKRIQSHWWLVWSCDGSTVVYCGILNTIGDYCHTSHGAQVTTVDSRSITVVNCICMVTTGTLIQIHSWLLQAQEGIPVVHCKELDVIGDYCGDKRDHSGQLYGMECHWPLLKTNEGSTVVNCLPLVTTVKSKWILSGLLQPTENYWRIVL